MNAKRVVSNIAIVAGGLLMVAAFLIFLASGDAGGWYKPVTYGGFSLMVAGIVGRVVVMIQGSDEWSDSRWGTVMSFGSFGDPQVVERRWRMAFAIGFGLTAGGLGGCLTGLALEGITPLTYIFLGQMLVGSTLAFVAQINL